MSNDLMSENPFSGEPNLSMTERGLSVAGGLAIAALGAKSRPNQLLSLFAVIVGSALAIRGATGHCPAKAMLANQRT
jgi:uncharacterized membrane protein